MFTGTDTHTHVYEQTSFLLMIELDHCPFTKLIFFPSPSLSHSRKQERFITLVIPDKAKVFFFLKYSIYNCGSFYYFTFVVFGSFQCIHPPKNNANENKINKNLRLEMKKNISTKHKQSLDLILVHDYELFGRAKEKKKKIIRERER